MRRERGFSLIELIVVIAVLAIVAGVAVPRFMNQQGIRSEAAARQLAADLRFSQRLAATFGTPCGVVVGEGGTSYTVFQGAGFAPAEDPLTREPFVVNLSEKYSTVAAPVGAAVTFDTRGRPSFSAGFGGSFTIGGRTVAVEPETGAVRRP